MYTSSASTHTFTYIHIIRLSSATQSGLLLVPVDDTGVPVQGILHGSMWYHGTEASTCSIPSEQYNEFVGGGIQRECIVNYIVCRLRYSRNRP